MMSITDQGTGHERDRLGQRLEFGLDHGGLLVTWAAGGTRSHAAADPAEQLGKKLPRLTPDDVASVISLAARAPSIHNTQPWRFRPQENCIELLADPSRMLRAVDPTGRELMISCGAAVFGLRLGLRRIGRMPAVELMPDPAQPRLVARVSPVGHAARTQVEADLITAVPHRHTHRGAFSPGQVPDRLLAAMVIDAAAEGCELAVMGDTKMIARLDRLVRGAAAAQRANPDIAAELASWVRPMHSETRDGVPATARVADHSGVTRSGRVDGLVAGGHVAHRRSAGERPERLAGRDFGLPGTEDPSGEPPSATAVLLTPADAPADWLRAGQALDRVLLRAAARWVFASLQSQPLESPRYRHAVRSLLGGDGYPQMVLQFGRANTAIATPRRLQAEMLAPQQEG